MPKVTWTEAMSVGVAELDAQHRRWIEMINELHDTLLHGGGRDLVAVTGRMLAEMAAYAGDHFQAEEAHMAAVGFPALEEHRRVHQAFRRRIAELRAEEEAGRRILNTELMKELLAWLSDHIMTMDKTYAATTPAEPTR